MDKTSNDNKRYRHNITDVRMSCILMFKNMYGIQQLDINPLVEQLQEN